MITIDDIAKPGSTVLYDGRPTTVLTGHYEDAELGWMIKTSLFPGGMPANKYTLPTQAPGPVETVEIIPPVSFELAIIDEIEPVKITAELIRQKVKPLTDLKIASIFDDKGYEAVKKAVTKAVKVRTGIEKQEKEVLGRYKTEYDTKKKEVTDYTAELYKACREAQTALEAKLTAIDNEKKIAADKLANEEKERTEGREAKMYEVGLTFNGQAFVGYGKTITKNSLHSFSQEAFDSLVTELEVLQMDSEVSGKPQEVVSPVEQSPIIGSPSISGAIRESKPTYANAIYDKLIFGKDIRVVLTKGIIEKVEPEALIINDRIAESAIYLQVIDYTI